METYCSIKEMGLKDQGFVCSIVGKPGSGKTTLIKTMLSREFVGLFSYVLLCSPSKLEYADVVPDTQCNTKFDLTWIYKMINLIIMQKRKDKASVLLVIDDSIAEIKDYEKDPKLISLFFNRRHLLWNGSLSILITTQKYTMIPARFRSCITDNIIFNLSPFDLAKVFEESIVKYSKKEWQEMLSKLFGKKFSYIHLNIDTQELIIN